MEKLDEVLMRVQHISEEESKEKVSRAKQLIESGLSPEEVLIEEYGLDTSYLESILDPRCSPDAIG